MSKLFKYKYIYINIFIYSTYILSMENNQTNDLKNKVNLYSVTKEIFTKKFDNPVKKAKKKENLLIISLENGYNLLIDIYKSKTLLDKLHSITISNKNKFTVIENGNDPIKIINFDENEKSIIPIDEKHLFSKPLFTKNGNLVFLNTNSSKSYLIDLKKNNIVKQFYGMAYAEKITNNDLFFALNTGLKYKVFSINNNSLKNFGTFLGSGQLSNTGEFLYGKIRATSTSKIFGKIEPIFLNKMDNSRPHLPKLVNLKTNKIVKCFEDWAKTNDFSKKDNFFIFGEITIENNLYTLIIDLKYGKILKKFEGYSNSIFSSNDKFLLISYNKKLENNSFTEKSNITELINTHKMTTIKKFNDINISKSKFSKNCKLLLLTMLNNSKEILNLEKNTKIAKFSSKINCGLTKDCIWLEKPDTNQFNFKLLKYLEEITIFKNKMNEKRKNKMIFCDTLIKTKN